VFGLFGASSSAYAAEAESVRAPKASDLRIAAERFDEGRTAFKAAAYAEAAEHFEAADARAPSSNALVLAMRSRAEAGHYAKAATLAEILRIRHADNADLVAQAERVIAEYTAQLGRLDIECSKQCELVVDQKLVHGVAKREWRVYVEPGAHTVVANFDADMDASTETEVAVGQTVSLRLAVTSEPAPVEVPPSVPQPKTSAKVTPSTAIPPVGNPRHGLHPTFFWIGVGATAVLGGVTIWSGIDTQNNPGPAAVREECAGQGTSCSLYQEGQDKELRTNLLLGGTIVLAIATTVTGVFATDFNRASSTPQRGAPNWSVRPVAAIGFGQSTLLGAEGRF
jgi:hypothetical protein